MKKLFEPAKLGALVIPNRLVRSATLEYGCVDKGVINGELLKVYEELAHGGIGLIITGMMGVAPNAEVREAMAQIYHESFAENFSKIADAVHKAGAKIVVQLGQCGAKSLYITRGDHPYAPSDIQLEGMLPAKAMTKAEIAQLVKDYGAAALRCREAGADGVQIHGAHGYLISQFLSPYFNKRTDEYGGPIANRARLVLDAYDEIRRAVGRGYPVLIKINYSDLVEGGIESKDSVWVCSELSKRGMDAIEVSAGLSIGGNTRPSQVGFKREAYFGEWALDTASQTVCPVIAMGGFRTPAVMEEWLNKGNIEAVSLCRPLIREPDLPNRWKKDPAVKPACISCNKCYSSVKHGCNLLQQH